MLLAYSVYSFTKTKNNSSDINTIQRGNGANNGLKWGKGNSKACYLDDCLAVVDLNYPVSSKITNDAKESLYKALDDEYKALATYEAVISKFGSVRPFIMIVRAEEQHISSLKSLFDKYGLDIPVNPYVGKVSLPLTLGEACSTGVTAEIENAALYKDMLLPKVSEYSDIQSVFTNLMNASEQKHLPAFKRCAK